MLPWGNVSCAWSIYHCQEARPVVLVVVDKGPQSLVEILVHNLRLTVCLRVVGCGELDLYSYDRTELTPELGPLSETIVSGMPRH